MRPPLVPTTLVINKDDSKQIIIMKSLYNSLIEYREPKTHRILIQLFMCLPSRKDFPEYFNIIEKPIAMNKIKDRIERHLYPDEDSCMEDFKLMFSNCKFFNEDDSQIYQDAVILENTLRKRREQLHIEFNRPSRDSKDAAKEAILNNSAPTPTTLSSPVANNNNINNNNATTPTISTRSERLNNINNNNSTNHVTSNTNQASSSSSSTSSSLPSSSSNNNNNNNKLDNDNSSSIKQETDNTNQNNDNSNSGPNHVNSTTNNTATNSSTSTNNHNHDNSSPSKPLISSSNGVRSDEASRDSQLKTDSTNGVLNDESSMDTSSTIRINHNHHNEASMDSASNLSADLLASTPIEKCSLNTRRGKNSDAPKRQLLTGYIIYASEIRKQVIDKNPNQNFGDISRLVGNEWKALPHDIRSKYDQRALIHNKRVRERLQRELANGGERLSNGLHTPKLTKRKLAKLAKEQMRQHHLSISGIYEDSSSTQSPRLSQDKNSSSTMVSQTPSSTFKNVNHQTHSQHQAQTSHQHHQATSSKTTTVETSTQTTAIRFVEPPTKKRLVYSETFKKYIESLPVPNKDLLNDETIPERPIEQPNSWLGAGIGRHESPEAALWAMRDFMLQDAVTMRRSMEPYL